MTQYIAFDVHAESTTCVVLSSAGKRLREGVVETSASALISFLQNVLRAAAMVREEICGLVSKKAEVERKVSFTLNVRVAPPRPRQPLDLV